MTEPLNWSIATEQSATSTSDLAKRAAANGAPSGQAFLAIEQTAGRGRHGRHWDSQKGGMYLSVLLRTSVPIDQWFALSFAASLAVLEAVRAKLATHLSSAEMPQTGLKWPNDVIVAGGKISGILLDVDGKALIVGSGINIAPVGQMESQNIAPIALADVWPDGAGALPHPMILLPPILTGWHSGMIGSASQVLTQFATHGWKTHCFWASALPFSATQRRFQGFFTILAWTARCFCLMIQVRHAISLQVM